jgi:lipopolysaccharide transport system ATP-binding protein
VPETVIRVVQLGKQFRVPGAKENYKTLRKSINQALLAPARLAARPFRKNKPAPIRPASMLWALRDLSFEVKQGEVLGVVGHNGAGKSTLFKILSRITEPTEGYVDIAGRVGSLLEVGTGFHSELSGRENVYLNGAILGMRRHEISKKFDEIVAFSEVGRYIDAPVKHYSSGMYLRLAFAVAAHLEPEILIVDEVLAVGDAAFQKKCIGKMSEVASAGRTVLFVSHNMSAVLRLCQTGIMLKAGQIVAAGDAESVVRQYMAQGAALAGEIAFDLSARPWERLRAVAFTKGQILDEQGEVSATVRATRGFTLRVHYQVSKPVNNALIGFRLWNGQGVCVLTSTDLDTDAERRNATLPPGDYSGSCTVPADYLRPGNYWLDLISHIPGSELLDEQQQCLSFEVLDDGTIESVLGQARQGLVGPLLAWQRTLLG